MRRGEKSAIRMLVALYAVGSTMPVEAQPFGFLFAAPRHRVRARRDPTPIEAPMPVPRPHFASDPSLPDAKRPEAAPVLTARHPEPATDAQGATSEPNAGAPLPPPKPAELDKSQTKPAPESSTPSRIVAGPPAAAKANPAEAQKPAVSPAGASQAVTPRSPADDPGCPGKLSARHVAAAPIAIGPQPDVRCTVVEPVKLTSLKMQDGTFVEFPDGPTIACTTADTFSLYVRDLLVPLAKGTFGSPVAAVWTGPGLECRSRDHIFGAKLSAHGQGLAIDIAQIKLADGRLIAVGEPKTDADTGFETAARAAACGYFHTVLGPGSDSYHRTHWHFDLEVRGSGGDAKYCK